MILILNLASNVIVCSLFGFVLHTDHVILMHLFELKIRLQCRIYWPATVFHEFYMLSKCWLMDMGSTTNTKSRNKRKTEIYRTKNSYAKSDGSEELILKQIKRCRCLCVFEYMLNAIWRGVNLSDSTKCYYFFLFLLFVHWTVTSLMIFLFFHLVFISHLNYSAFFY